MKTTHILISLILLLGCLSCSEDDPQPEPLTKAYITGQVKLFDNFTSPLDNADMTVRIDGQDIAAKTDAEGKFTLPDLPFGTYNLVYEKPGYGTYKIFGLIHSPYNNSGSGTIIDNPGSGTFIEGTLNLGQISPTRVTGLSVEVTATDVVLTVTTDPPGSVGNEKYIRYFYGSTQYFGEDFVIGSEGQINFFYSEIIAIQSNPQVITIPLDEFGYTYWGELFLFSPGEKVFIRAFGDSYWDNHYFDPYLGYTVRPNLNPSAADQVSLIIP